MIELTEIERKEILDGNEEVLDLYLSSVKREMFLTPRTGLKEAEKLRQELAVEKEKNRVNKILRNSDKSKDGPKSMYNIVHIAELIQESIREYYQFNPNDDKEDEARKYAMEKAMRFGKGKFNPIQIESIILMENSCYPEHVCRQC